MTYDIFISYKRGGSSSATAAYLYDLLTKKGYSVFFDRKEIRQGQFNTQLLSHIENAKDIIILLDDHSLKACFNDIKDTYKTDWFCMEVMHSLLKKKRIIPLLLEGYCMPEAETLPEEMRALSLQNAISLDISDIEDFYKKYLIGQEYLISKPRNIYLSQTKGEGVADFLFYSDGECDLFECGNLIGSLNINTDEDHPYRHPVQRCGEHRFYCRNNNTCEEQRIIENIDVNSQKYINIKWSSNQNLWELTENDIINQNDSRILFIWGKGLFEGTSKYNPNASLAFLCLKEAANKWNIDARNFIVEQVKGLFSMEMSLEDRLAWYEKAIEFDSADAYEILGRYYDEGKVVERDLKKAFEYGMKALQIRIEKFGEMNSDVAMSYHNLGRVCSAEGDETKALFYYEKALKIRTSIYGENHPELAKTLNNMANIYKSQNRKEDALNTYLRAIEIKETAYSEKHPSLAVSYANLGNLYRKNGNYDMALDYYNKAIEIQEDVLGPQHPDLASTLMNLARLYRFQENYDKAIEYSQKALDIRKTVFGEKDMLTAYSYIFLGTLYHKKGEFDKAHEFSQKAYCVYEETLKNKPDYKNLYNKIAWSLHLLDRYEEALPWAEKAVDAFPESPNVWDTMATVYQDNKQYQKALDSFEKCLKLHQDNGDEYGIRMTTGKIEQLKTIIS